METLTAAAVNHGCPGGRRVLLRVSGDHVPSASADFQGGASVLPLHDLLCLSS